MPLLAAHTSLLDGVNRLREFLSAPRAECDLDCAVPFTRRDIPHSGIVLVHDLFLEAASVFQVRPLPHLLAAVGAVGLVHLIFGIRAHFSSFSTFRSLPINCPQECGIGWFSMSALKLSRLSRASSMNSLAWFSRFTSNSASRSRSLRIADSAESTVEYGP